MCVNRTPLGELCQTDSYYKYVLIVSAYNKTVTSHRGITQRKRVIHLPGEYCLPFQLTLLKRRVGMTTQTVGPVKGIQNYTFLCVETL